MTGLLSALPDWRTIVDVLLIAACLFSLYHTINRLGTWKIVVGILAAMMVFLMANFFDLPVLNGYIATSAVWLLLR